MICADLSITVDKLDERCVADRGAPERALSC